MDGWCVMQERKLYECIVVVKLDVLDLGVGGVGGAAIRDDLSLGMWRHLEEEL